jgi:cell division protein FtsI (penicillin-binding protein 3)
VNQPSFNPNNRKGASKDSYRNRAVTDLFEPGSTIKTFSMLSALGSGKFKPTSTVDTGNGSMILDGHRVSDPKTKGVIDMTTILKRSSNVGMTKVILALPPDLLWSTLQAVGFGQLTDSQYPGEAQGVLTKQTPWRPFALATLSFGYGMSSTLLQLAQAYSVLGNAGVKKPISLLRVNEVPAGKQVVNSQAVKDLLIMLESILSKDGGTAPLARVPGYRVTGKTSTTQVIGAHGYDKTRHNAGFTGLAPAEQPRLLVTVFLHDLRSSKDTMYYGGYTAGPIFSRIMEGSLRLLGVPPDEALTDAVVSKGSINSAATEKSKARAKTISPAKMRELMKELELEEENL